MLTEAKDNAFPPDTVSLLKPPSAELVSLYSRARYHEAKERRDRTVNSASSSVGGSGDCRTGSVTSASDARHSQRRKYTAIRRNERKEYRASGELPPQGRRGTTHTGLKLSMPPLSSNFTVAPQNLRFERIGLDASPLSISSLSTPSQSSLITTSDYLERLEDDADIIKRIRLSRKYFYLWADRTAKQSQHRERLEELANAFNKRVLLIEALATWYQTTRSRQIQYARDIYLLRTTLGQWMHKTSAVVNRTNEMRTRIMVRKYFNAWVSLVRDKPQQIRKFQLTNALYRWRLALFRRKQQDTYAEQVYETNLVSKFRKRWWFQACEAMAPSIHNNFLIREVLSTWCQQTSAIEHNKGVAHRRFNTHLVHRVYQHWLERVDDILDMGEDAADHHDWSIASKYLGAWRRRTAHAPTVSLVMQRVDRRLVSTFFNTWRQRCRQSLAARALLTAHTLRRTFTTWNLSLRHNIVANHIQDRIVSNALYNWVLQTRYSIFTNDVKRWLLARNTLTHWRRQTRAVARQRRNNHYRAVHTLKTHLTSKFFGLWRARLAHEAERKARAVQLFNRIHATAALNPWITRVKQVLTVQAWVAPTHSYLLLRKHLRRWRIALEHAQRQKLRRAYKQFVLVKRRELATRVINHWHSRTQVLHAMKWSAEHFDASHIALTAEAAFRTWRGNLANITQLNQVQKAWPNLPLMRTYLGMWMSYLKHLRHLEDVAQNFSDIRVTEMAFKMLTKWQTKLFLFRSRETAAKLMGERTEKRRVVSLLRFWQAEAGKRRDFRKFAEGLDEREDTDSKEGQRSVDWEGLVHGGLQEGVEEEQHAASVSIRRDAPTFLKRSRFQTPRRTHWASPLVQRQSSESLIDFETPRRSTPQPFSVSSIRRTLFVPDALLNPEQTSHPLKGFQPQLPSGFKNPVVTSTPAHPPLRNVLRTPKARAAQAREFSNMAFNPSTSARALPTRGTQHQAGPALIPVVPSSITQWYFMTEGTSPQTPTPEGGVLLPEEEVEVVEVVEEEEEKTGDVEEEGRKGKGATLTPIKSPFISKPSPFLGRPPASRTPLI